MTSLPTEQAADPHEFDVPYPAEMSDEEMKRYYPNAPKLLMAVVGERIYKRESGRWWLLGN